MRKKTCPVIRSQPGQRWDETKLADLVARRLAFHGPMPIVLQEGGFLGSDELVNDGG